MGSKLEGTLWISWEASRAWERAGSRWNDFEPASGRRNGASSHSIVWAEGSLSFKSNLWVKSGGILKWEREGGQDGIEEECVAWGDFLTFFLSTVDWWTWNWTTIDWTIREHVLPSLRLHTNRCEQWEDILPTPEGFPGSKGQRFNSFYCHFAVS